MGLEGVALLVLELIANSIDRFYEVLGIGGGREAIAGWCEGLDYIRMKRI